MREQRQYQRAKVSLDVVVETEDGASLTGRSTDLSQGGMFIETTSNLPFGSKVVIACSLPRLDARLPAVVRWTKPGGFGVQFGLLGARETHAIGQLLRNSAADD